MKLTWRDAAAAVPVAMAVAAYAAYRTDAALPLLAGPRTLATAVFVLGVGACILGGGIMPGGVPQPRNRWRKALGLHGPAAVLITVIVWISGSPTVLAALVALLVLMWVITTIHHALRPSVRRPVVRV
jgi:hypothetical protein